MSLTSSRLAIAEGLVLLLQGVTNPTTSLPLYHYCKLGTVFDPSPFQSWAEVTFYKSTSGPAGSGGTNAVIGWRIEDMLTLKITSGWVYERDSTVATQNMLGAMDIIMPMLHSHYQIPSPANPAQAIASVYSVLEDPPESVSDKSYPNGKVYLLWDCYVVVKQNYNVTLIGT